MASSGVPYGPCPISPYPHSWIRRNTLGFSMRDYLLLPGADPYDPSAVDLDVAALCQATWTWMSPPCGNTMFNPCVKSPKGSETAEELGLVVSDVLGKESALPEHFYALPPLTIFHFSAPLRASE